MECTDKQLVIIMPFTIKGNPMMENKNECQNKSAYRFTWPGRDESFICTEHVGHLKAVANAMGWPLQIIELDDSQDQRPNCTQKVSP